MTVALWLTKTVKLVYEQITKKVYLFLFPVLPAMIAATWAGVKAHFGNSSEDILAPKE